MLIRGAIPGFQSPITPEELGGLAMEPEAESRIVCLEDGAWSLEHGPFNEHDFQRKGKWSLLVQRVDEWFPEVMALRGCVDFLPQWRFDDIMVSYATDGAGVARVVGEAGGGAVRARADGRGHLVEVVVAPAVAGATAEIGPLVTEAVRDAQEKASALAAHEFGRVAEELNLPIPPETLRGLLGGAS